MKAAAILVAQTGAVSGVVADPADDPILDAAISAQVDYLVTGDKRVLAVNEYAGLRLPRLKAGDSDQLLLRSFRLRSANASQVGAVSSGPSTGRVRPKPAPVAPTL